MFVDMSNCQNAPFLGDTSIAPSSGSDVPVVKMEPPGSQRRGSSSNGAFCSAANCRHSRGKQTQLSFINFPKDKKGESLHFFSEG